ncbi:MAG: MBL fold metallo-hydrolase [SAR202 cluster bacterium]|nr:MBL fold metallo-hydrolase [SAR202 cluster bacterium]
MSIAVASNVRKAILGTSVNNVYLITGKKAAVLFDSGWDEGDNIERVLAMWKDAGSPKIAAIVLSHKHRDHSGGALKLSQATGGKVYATAIDQALIAADQPEQRVDVNPKDGETIDIGGETIELIHTPGHTMGSLSAYHREQRILFAGDSIRTAAPFRWDKVNGSLPVHLETLKKLQKRDIALIGVGHGPEVTDPTAFIANELAILPARLGEK